VSASQIRGLTSGSRGKQSQPFRRASGRGVRRHPPPSCVPSSSSAKRGARCHDSKHANDEIDTSTRWIVRCARFGRTGSRDGLASTPAARFPWKGASPSGEGSLFESSRTTATWTSRPLRSEREEPRVRPRALPRALPTPVKRSISPRSTFQSPIRSGPWGAPLALPRTGSSARAGQSVQPKPSSVSSLARRHCREESPLRRPDPLSREPSCEVVAPVRFCHRGYPRALNPILHQPRRVRAGAHLPEEILGWAWRELSLTSDAGPLCREPLPTPPSSCSPSDPRLGGAAGGSTRASSTSRCGMGDHSNAETLDRSITVCPFSPPRACARRLLSGQALRSRERAGASVGRLRRANTSPFGSAFDELMESRAKERPREG
jgi:hypothetical protein